MLKKKRREMCAYLLKFFIKMCGKPLVEFLMLTISCFFSIGRIDRQVLHLFIKTMTINYGLPNRTLTSKDILLEST